MSEDCSNLDQIWM